MRTWITLGVVLIASGLSYGVTPEQQLAEEIAELREQLGVEGAVAADDQGFAAAIAKLAAAPPTSQGYWDAPKVFAEDRPPRDTWDTPSAWVEDRPSPPPFDPPPRPTPAETQPWPSLPTPPPAFSPAAFDQPQARRPPGPRPAHYDAGPARPKHLLRRTAAELDRLANELENAELYRQADALRDSAGMLRQSARRLNPEQSAVRGDRPNRDLEPGAPPRYRGGDMGPPPRPEGGDMGPPPRLRDGEAGPPPRDERPRDERRRDRGRPDRPERPERPERPDRPGRPAPPEGDPAPGPR